MKTSILILLLALTGCGDGTIPDDELTQASEIPNCEQLCEDDPALLLYKDESKDFLCICDLDAL